MILPNLSLEKSLWRKGLNYVVGIDEVGRGSWAGPLVAAGVIFPPKVSLLDGLTDSKLLKDKKRRKLAKEIKKIAFAFSIAEISNQRIDTIGIAKATQQAFRKVVRSLKLRPDFCLIDAFYIKYFPRKNQQAIKKGDQICASISAASIIAKVYRDKLMRKFDRKFPKYGFAKHKGYGTQNHQNAIRQYGLCEIHRRSFRILTN